MRKKRSKGDPSPLDVVALLSDLATQWLARGQVGTIVEHLDDATMLVEFSDDQGHAYALAPCPRTELLVLHYVPSSLTSDAVRATSLHPTPRQSVRALSLRARRSNPDPSAAPGLLRRYASLNDMP
jgi:hypothetical protein